MPSMVFHIFLCLLLLVMMQVRLLHRWRYGGSIPREVTAFDFTIY
ncbi:hypothetical protein EVA_22248 [gut metagenome]|uniref:Secreted protein n=1 Tax=gut metagenome TaxID=749906 RepID=J9F571_9ZZZZ